MKFVLFFGVVLNLFASLAFAGTETSGGGDALVCYENSEDGIATADRLRKALLEKRKSKYPKSPFNDPTQKDLLTKIKDVKTLDLYMYLRPSVSGSKREVVPMKDGETSGEYAIRLFKRLEKRISLGSELLKAAQDLDLENNWHGNPGVIEVDDQNTDVLYLPQCVLVQLAVQKEKFVDFDETLLSKMTDLDRAVLFMHELSYYFARNNSYFESDRGSRDVRGLISILLNPNLETLAMGKLYQKINDLPDIADYNRFSDKVNNAVYRCTQQVQSATFDYDCSDGTFYENGLFYHARVISSKGQIEYGVFGEKRRFTLTAKDADGAKYIYLNQQGLIEGTVYVQSAVSLMPGVLENKAGYHLSIIDSKVKHVAGRKVLGALEFPVAGGKVTLGPDSNEIGFYEDGSLSAGYVKDPQALMISTGQRLKMSGMIYFDDYNFPFYFKLAEPAEILGRKFEAGSVVNVKDLKKD